MAEIVAIENAFAQRLKSEKLSDLPLILPPIQRLDDLCVQVIAENYYDYPVLDKIPPQYLDSVIALLDPSQISLETASKYIETEKFWKRMCERWQNCQPELHGASWKRLYLERNLEELLELYETPPTFTEEEEHGFISLQTTITALANSVIPAPSSAPTASGGSNPVTGGIPLATLKTRFAERQQAQAQYSRLLVELSASRALVHTLRLHQLPAHLNLFELLKDFPNLSTLDLSYGAKHVGMDYDASLFGMKLTDVASLAQLLATTRTLNRLILPQSQLNDDAMHVLMSGLLKNETLTSLDLSHNRIGDLGARRLAKLLEAQNVLTSLQLGDNAIHAAGAKFIGRALSHNQTLTTLDLRMNVVSDEGGKAIFDGLRENSVLQILNLSGNQMGSEAGRAMQSMLNQNSVLQDVDVSCNHIADEADDKQLKASILGNQSLTRLDLRRNALLEETVEEIRRALQKREVELKRARRKRFLHGGEWTD